MKGKEIWYEFDETGFGCGLANGESHLKWPAISNFNETETLLVVMESGVLFYPSERLRRMTSAPYGSYWWRRCRLRRNWCNIAITLIDRVVSVIA